MDGCQNEASNVMSTWALIGTDKNGTFKLVVTVIAIITCRTSMLKFMYK